MARLSVALLIVPLLAGVSGIVHPTFASAEEPSLADRIHPFADMRLRYESDSDRLNDKNWRQRGRIRVRVGATADIAEGVIAGLRVRTGNKDDSNSPYHNIGDDFSSLEIALDRAYVDWSPKQVPGLRLLGGKMARGFKNTPVYGELVWDDDVNPEGVQARYQHGFDDVKVGGVLGTYVVSQANSGSETAYLISVQGWVEAKPMDDLKFVTAVGFDGYGNLFDGGAGSTSGKVPSSNAPKILHPIAHLTWSGLDVPITLTAEYINNVDTTHQDEGWAAGAAVGFPLFGKNHKAYYQFQKIDARAVYRDEAEDDFALPSNYNGHVFGIKWKIAKRISAHTWGIYTQDRASGATDTHEKRFRIDLNFKF